MSDQLESASGTVAKGPMLSCAQLFGILGDGEGCPGGRLRDYRFALNCWFSRRLGG
jgi:hypothetical protein